MYNSVMVWNNDYKRKLILIVLYSGRGSSFFRLLGAVSSAKTGCHLRIRDSRGSLQHFDNRCKRLSGAELRIGNLILLVGYHKPTSV